MKYFIALLVAFFAFALPAHAALNYDGWDTGPGGLSTPYPAVNPEVYAGLLEVSHWDSTILVFADSFTDRVSVGDFWAGDVYTYADVMAGAPVKFTPVQYARAAALLDSYMVDFMDPNTSLTQWAGNIGGSSALAFINTQVWDIMNPELGLLPGDQCMNCDAYDWSQTMVVISPTGIAGDEWLAPIRGQVVSSVPEPKAFWLLASGLLLVGYVARRKSLQEARIK